MDAHCHHCRALWLSRIASTVLCLCPTIALAQTLRPSEYQVKAAYLYDFSRFVEWPSQPRTGGKAVFAICVLGKDPFGPILDAALAGEARADQNLVVRRISNLQDALACRILFISASEQDRLKEVLTAMNKASVLTVSDIPRFSERGGMIEFVLKDDKIRFDVNLASAMDAGLIVSSDLLKVALTVRRHVRSGD